MLLRVRDRLFIIDILPQVGDYTTLKVVRTMREALSFSEEEHKNLKFVHEGNGVAWDEGADSPVDIAVGEVATNIIVDALKELNSRRLLKDEFLPLYEHFVEGEEWSLDSVRPDNGTEPTPLQPELRTTKEALGSSPLAEGEQES